MTSHLCKASFLLGLVFLIAARGSATLYDAHAQESCETFVHIDSAQTHTDDRRSPYSSYTARVLSPSNCGAMPGDSIRFMAPGGITGTFATTVNAIHIEKDKDVVIHLSRAVGSRGLPFAFRTESAPGSNLKRAFECTRIGSSGPSIFWQNRVVELRPSLPQNASLSLELLVDAMQWAAQQWSHAGGSDFSFQIGAPVTQRWAGFDWSQKRPNYNIVTVREGIQDDFYSEWIHEAGVIAVTRITHIQKTGEIVDADIEINLANFSFKDCAQKPYACAHSFDLKNTLTHEFGHALGLGHPDARLEKSLNATMFSKSEAGEIRKRWLSPDDKLGIAFLYPKGEESPECFGVGRAPKKDYKITTDTGCNQGHTPSFWAIGLCLASLCLRFRQKRRPKLAIGRNSL